MKIITIAFLLSLLLAACGGINPLVPTDAIEPTGDEASTSVLPVATPVTLIADIVPVTTYVDPDLGYAFDFPADWTITSLPEVPGATVTIHSWDPAELTGDRPQSEGIPEGGEKLDITPLTNFELDYAQAQPWFRDQNVDRSFTEEQVTLPTGLPGILYIFDQTEEVGIRCLLTEVKDAAILACGLAWGFQFFEPIAFSLRPAN